MKFTVLTDKSGKLEAVAILNPAPTGSFHVEVEGGGPVVEMNVDVDPEAVMGKKGAEAHKEAHEKLRRKL